MQSRGRHTDITVIISTELSPTYSSSEIQHQRMVSIHWVSSEIQQQRVVSILWVNSEIQHQRVHGEHPMG